MSEEEIIKDYDFEKVTRSEVERGSESVAVEKSYDLSINGVKINTILATPTDLEGLVYGYLISEGILKSKDQIKSVEVNDNVIECLAERFEDFEREFELRSSGCIGSRWSEDNEQDVPKVESQFQTSNKLIFNALQHLNNELYRKTSGSHSASLINGDNKNITKAIDVGRHNAVDKAIGKGLLKGIDFSNKILLASGRQSAGMVMKGAKVGLPIIISKAAPLTSGIKAAEKFGITLICFADEEKFKIFSGSNRIEK